MSRDTSRTWCNETVLEERRLRKGWAMEDVAKDLDRRQFLRHAAAITASSVAALALPPAYSEEVKVPDDPMRVPGRLPRAYGDRAPFEQTIRLGGAGPGAPHG